MIHDVVMPQLAMGMSEGKIVAWLVTDGQQVDRDMPLAEIETEKVVVELPAPESGRINLLVPAGETVPVETILARLSDGGDETAAALPVPPAERTPSPSASEAGTERIKVSGLARRIARNEGLDLSRIRGTGPKGRIVRRDVEEALRSGPAPNPEGGPRQDRERARRPLSGMRKAIGRATTEAYRHAAQTFLFFELDVTRLLRARTRMNRDRQAGDRISLTALYLKALARAVEIVPGGNATLEGDEIVFWRPVDVSLAVAVTGETEGETGILTPVLRDAGTKSLGEVSAEIRHLAARARDGTLAPAESVGGTVTLSSGGFYPEAGLVGTPILTLPQALSFSPGRPIQKPVVRDGAIVIADILPCTMTFDHRVLDGEPAARIAREIGARLQDPEMLLL